MKNCWKKIAALFCAAAMMFSFTACALEDPEQTSSEESSGSESSKEEVSQISDEDAEDSLKGLVLYLDAKGYLSENSVEMSASMIGAD